MYSYVHVGFRVQGLGFRVYGVGLRMFSYVFIEFRGSGV